MAGSRRNLITAWYRREAPDEEFGRRAYKVYHQAMRAFGEFYGVGLVPTTEAFAALSPNNDYHGNLRSLSAVLFCHAAGVDFDKLTISTYRACGKRALSYVAGEASFLDTVAGPKITAFRHNILYPTHSRRATIDGHMIALWHGRELTMKQAAAVMKSEKEYREIEKATASLAATVGRPVPEVQATLWGMRKRELGLRFSTQTELFSGESKWQEAPKPEDYPPYQMELWREWMSTRGDAHVQKIGRGHGSCPQGGGLETV